MRYFLALILTGIYTFALHAQAQLDQVRAMFDKPNEHIQVGIWKGVLENVHPVIFYLAIEEDIAKGYYRIVSSGDEYQLDGEVRNNQIFLTETNASGEIVGYFRSRHVPLYDAGMTLNFKWFNYDQSNVLQVKLDATRFADLPRSVFKPYIHKYHSTDTEESIILEALTADRYVIHYLNDKEEHIQAYSLKAQDTSIQVQLNQKQIEYQLNSKQVLVDGKPFELKQKLNLQHVAFAQDQSLSQVEYPQMDHAGFNRWMQNYIKDEKAKVRTEITQLCQKNPSEASSHFLYTWEAWTVIDYLNEDIISGRIFWNTSWKSNWTVQPFTYDLKNNEEIDVRKDIHQEAFTVQMQQAIQSYILSQQHKTGCELKPNDFRYVSFGKHELLISTAWNYNCGDAVVRIPYTSLDKPIRRNKIIKTILRS